MFTCMCNIAGIPRVYISLFSRCLFDMFVRTLVHTSTHKHTCSVTQRQEMNFVQFCSPEILHKVIYSTFSFALDLDLQKCNQSLLLMWLS